MHCPKCNQTSLKPHKFKNTDVVVDVCQRCKGIWFDANELNELLPVASKDLQVPKDAKPTGMTCPKCLVPLEAFSYPQTCVEIDMCSKCNGLWLYKSELKEIKIVRGKLEKKGKLETHAPVAGIKGEALTWVNWAIEKLMKFD
ncbi:zf-TFIIB domain-containing protein [Aeoliella sp.]|uniref:zf-TFIIB domain-containing protein n=1 Tax=Aeoliella sp. TaxID=2795800 RepID=UPI003CCC2121